MSEDSIVYGQGIPQGPLSSSGRAVTDNANAKQTRKEHLFSIQGKGAHTRLDSELEANVPGAAEMSQTNV